MERESLTVLCRCPSLSNSKRQHRGSCVVPELTEVNGPQLGGEGAQPVMAHAQYRPDAMACDHHSLMGGSCVAS